MKGTIIYWGNFELPDKNASANRVVSNGKIFTKLGYRVVFLGSRATSNYFDGIKQTLFNENMFEECYPASTKLWFKYVFDISTIKQLINRFTDIKLVVAYNIPYSKFSNLKKYLYKKGIPAAYDCTEWNDLTDGNVMKRLYKKLDLFQIKHFLDRKADGLIVISKRMEQYYKNRNIVRIPPLIDIEDEIWHQPMKKDPNGFEFCFAGTISNKEALDKIITAFNHINDKNSYLRIIGLTKKDVQQMYPDLGEVADNPRLIFMGQLSHEEAVKYVQCCECYIFLRYDNPRNQAGFPTKFAEAYACGVPIITTNVSDIKEYMNSNDDGVLLENILEVEITDAMSNIIAAKLDNKELRKDFDYRNYTQKAEGWLSMILPEGEVG